MKNLLSAVGLLCVITSQFSALEINSKTVDKICTLGGAPVIGAVNPDGDIDVLNISFFQEGDIVEAAARVNLLVNCETKKSRLEYSTDILLSSVILKSCPLPPVSADWNERINQKGWYVKANPDSSLYIGYIIVNVKEFSSQIINIIQEQTNDLAV